MADKDKLLIRKFMKEISDNISRSELEELKFLCGIESAIDSNITKAYQVFDILEKRGALYHKYYTYLLFSYVMLRICQKHLKVYQRVSIPLTRILAAIKIFII